MKRLSYLLKTMRPKQWTKNVIIFAALIFDGKLTHRVPLLQTCAGFILFCLISGVVYTLNDVVDLEKDKLHPRKRFRPLPSGQLNRRFAITGTSVIAMISFICAYQLNRGFFLVLMGYFGLQLIYAFVLKHIVLLDVMAIAAGFVLRVSAGIPLVHPERFSPWLYICTTLLALFLGLSKRRGELILLEDEAEEHRKTLKEYTVYLLDQLINMVSASTILAYALYTFSAPNLPTNYAMMLTIPFVIYGLFRYLYLIHTQACTLPPDEVLLTDRPFQINIVLWGISAMLILYIG
ncbi:MAG: decaprenyl-phosphate phosphoribosyltransferase [Anaerolineae bacterium]|nr:decaprenyl-phosphate phosphoribosyltransferase [Anaerolineae bacterium]